MSLLVACVFVRGYVGYTADYVVRLRNMVARHLKRDHKFVCLTDQPASMVAHGIEFLVVSTPSYKFPWWAKIHLFGSRVGGFGADRHLYLDLDSLVVSDLSSIVDYRSKFALVPHAGSFEGKFGKAVVKRFNSSVMVWDRGQGADIFYNCSPAVEDRLWGDQDWIGEIYPGADVMPAEWFPRISDLQDPAQQVRAGNAKVVLCKKPKNHVAAQKHAWVREVWQ